MRRKFQRVALLSAVGLGVCLAGCRREVRYPETGATLEGTVKYGTEKVLVALVIAQGKDWSSSGFIGDDGRYKLDNVPLGEVNLAVNTDAGKGQMMGKLMARSQTKSKDPIPKMINVPAKYANPSTSGITTTINKGPNTFDIVIAK
jgi:hypothetical protein